MLKRKTMVEQYRELMANKNKDGFIKDVNKKKPGSKRLTINNMDVSVIDYIKRKSKEMGCSIAEFLAIEFDGRVVSAKPKFSAWTIWNFDSSVRDDIVNGAKKENVSIPNFLKKIMDERNKEIIVNQDIVKIEKRVKKELVKELMECLKNFRKY